MKALFALLFFSLSCFQGGEVLMGKMGFHDLKNNKLISWFDKGVEAYKPDATAVKQLKKLKKKNHKVVVFAGSWCEDTEKLLPGYYAALKKAGIDPDVKTEMYFVDRKKRSGLDIEMQYKVTNVPVFILVVDGKEKGRITETAKVSIEADLAALLQ